MKNKFFESLTTKNLLTENGMPTHSSSESFVVDLFYKMGGYRQGRTSRNELVALFFAAFGENPNLAVKCLFNLRDPRGGMGERESGRVLWHFLAQAHPDLAVKLLPYIPAYSRWDDLFYFIGTPIEDEALAFYLQALLRGDKLAAKWAVRENKRGPAVFQKGEVAKILMKKWGMSPKIYRELLARNTKVVETLMCNRDWKNILFEHVPSQAVKNYRKAFQRHQEERWTEYLAAVERGEKKINTATLSPVEIVHEYLGKLPAWSYRTVKEVDNALETLWANLPDMVPESLSFIPCCDLSGSMFMNSQIPGEVSIALGIYLAQRNKSIFKNGFITFSNKPSFVYLKGSSLHDSLQQMRAINMAENTDLEAMFRLILQSAIREKLSQADLPTHLLIISDMQFDSCVARASDSVLEMVNRMYEEAGYKRPNIIFWNVDSASGIPAKVTDSGVALVSGYSPNLLKNVLQDKLDPLSQVLAILNNGRYDFINEIV